MKLSPSSAFSSARIKLRQRHLVEWHELTCNQRKIWKLIDEETVQKLPSYGNDKLACAIWTHRQATRLIKVVKNQREDRAQVKARHQQEKALFEQMFETLE